MTLLNLKQEPQHLPVLAAWHHAEWTHLNPGRSLQDRIQSMQAYLNDDQIPSTFIHRRDGQLTGSAALVDCDMDTRADLTPWLASVFVAPDYRRQGIGSELVRQVMKAAVQAGFEKLYLFTPDQVGFYQGLGWCIMEHTTYRDCPVTVMCVCLRDAHWT